MNNVYKIFLFEFKNKFKEKSIMISAIIMISMIFIGTFIPSIVNKVTNKTEEEKIKEETKEMEKVGIIINDKEIEPFVLNEQLKQAKKYSNEEDLINDIKSKEIKMGFVILNDTNYKILRSGSDHTFSNINDYGIKDNLSIYAKNKFYNKHNIDPKLVKEAEK